MVDCLNSFFSKIFISLIVSLRNVDHFMILENNLINVGKVTICERLSLKLAKSVLVKYNISRFFSMLEHEAVKISLLKAMNTENFS